MMKDMMKGLAQLVYPRLCESCGKSLLAEEEVLCLNCNIYKVPRTAYHHIPDNQTFMRFAGRVNIQRATSLAYFIADGLLQHLLHGLKYDDKKYIGVFLGKQLGYDLLQTNWHKGIDMIIPVPLHPKKEEIRGFNQAEVIAYGMSQAMNIPVNTTALVRNKFTESQTKKTREERIANMVDAFAVADNDEIKGKHILLIDDVLTTGATLESCALTLLNVEGVSVSIATIGIAN